MNSRILGAICLLLGGCGTALYEGASPSASVGVVASKEKIAEKSAGNDRKDVEGKSSAKKPPDETQANSKDGGEADSKKGDPKEKEEPKEGEKKEEIERHVTVRCVPAQRRAFSITINGLGRTEPLPDSVGAVTAAVEGHVHRVLATLGQSVKAGQPLIELDTTIARTALSEKIANRDSLVAALNLLKSLPRPEETKSAELAVAQAKVAIARAQAVLDELKTLGARQEVAQLKLYDAQQAVKQAELQRDTAQAQLKALTIGPRAEAVAEAQSKIAIAEQAVGNAKELLELHTLRAPIAGVVDSLNCHPGQTLTIGTPVGEIIDPARLFVTVYLSSRSLRNIRPGLAARIDLQEGSAVEPADSRSSAIVGAVAFVGRSADLQTKNFPVRILVNNAGGQLRLGQMVKATVTLRTEDQALCVPDVAIFDQGEGPLLAVVREGKIKQLHPELGVSEGGFTVVEKTDLKVGEKVVVEGGYNVPEGTSATEEAAPAGESNAHEKPAAEKAETHE